MDGWHGVGQSAWGSLRNPCPRPRRSALSSLRSPFHPYSRKVTATRQVLIHALASIRPRLTLEYYSGVVLGREGLFFLCVWVKFSPWQTIGWLCNLHGLEEVNVHALVCAAVARRSRVQVKPVRKRRMGGSGLDCCWWPACWGCWLVG